VDPARLLLNPVIASLVETVLVDDLDGPTPVEQEYLDQTSRVLLHRMVNMPRHLAAGMMMLTVAFDLSAVPAHGARFRALGVQHRGEHLGRWKAAPVGVFRDFVDFYEKMGVFVYYSHIEDAEHGHQELR
jgi:hypothetical protein